jgi:uncharacterized phage infection (PIP) family protein YhgE
MSFQTPEMSASRQPATLKTAAYATQVPQSPYPALNMDFGSMNLHVPTKRAATFTPFDHAFPKSHETRTTAAPPVTFQFNDATHLADLLSTPSKHNLDHFHAGLLNHTDAINKIASGMQTANSKYANLHEQLTTNNAFAHDVFDNHTGALNHLVDESKRVTEGMLNHKEVMEHQARMLQQNKVIIQQQTNEINQLKGQLEEHHSKFHTGMTNHTDVLRSHVGQLKSLSSQMGLYDTKINNHADSISKTADGLRSLQHNSIRQNEELRNQNASISSVTDTLNNVHLGLVHHTEALNSVGGRLNEHSDRMQQLKNSHTELGTRLGNLEAKFNTGDAYTQNELQTQIKDIKTAINSNAMLLDELLSERSTAGADSMTRLMASAPRR